MYFLFSISLYVFFSSFTFLCVIRVLCLKDFVGVGKKASELLVWSIQPAPPATDSCSFLSDPPKPLWPKCFIFKKWINSHNLCSKEKILLNNNCKISWHSFSNGVCCSLCSNVLFLHPAILPTVYLLFHPLSWHADALSSHLYHIPWLFPFPSRFHRLFLVPLKLMDVLAISMSTTKQDAVWVLLHLAQQ